MTLRWWFAAPAPTLALALAVAAPALAAEATHNITGIWTRTGSLNFDQDIPGNKADNPPYTPAYAAKWKAIQASEAAGKPNNDLSAQCLPPGFVRMMNSVYPMEILETPGQVTILPEWLGLPRRIFINGKHPADPDPSFNGHSIGHWEGNTLLVDTIAIKPDGILDDHGAPAGDNLHVKERIWLADPNTLKDEITLEDPTTFTRPYTVTKTLKRRHDIQIMEYVCEENNRNPIDANGVTGVILHGSK
jgi:hypothetical protein